MTSPDGHAILSGCAPKQLYQSRVRFTTGSCLGYYRIVSGLLQDSVPSSLSHTLPPPPPPPPPLSHAHFTPPPLPRTRSRALSLAVSIRHVDGSIYRFCFDENGGPAHIKLALHSSVPQVSSWGERDRKRKRASQREGEREREGGRERKRARARPPVHIQLALHILSPRFPKRN